MNIKEYIASGVVEAYVLGELTHSEKIEFEQNLTRYPELREEVRLSELTLQELAFNAAVAPRQKLRKQILELAQSASANERVVALNPSANYWRWAAAASIVLALVASVMAYTYRSRWVETKLNLENLIAQNQQFATNYNVVNERLTKLQQDFAVIENAAFQKVVLKGTANDPSALATVYWNASTEEVFLSIQNLRSLAAEQQFQLWAIVDGQPVDAGVFNKEGDGLLKMKLIKGAAAFAVTIEPRGGQASPTLSTMQVIGSVPRS